jgi:glycosyltransferase involved in cell wall biosynthesis
MVHPHAPGSIARAIAARAGNSWLKAMRIALFTETFLPKVDGIVTRLKHTVEQLQALGDQVLVFSPEGGLTEYQGAKIHGVSGMAFPLYPELKLALPRPSIGEALEQFQPDLIHVVNPAVLGLAGVFYAKSMDIPLMASYHTHLPKYLEHYGLGMLEGLMWELLKAVHNQARINLATSTAMQQELTEHGIERVEVWQRGVDTDLFRPELASREMRDRLSQGHPDAPYCSTSVASQPKKRWIALNLCWNRSPVLG